MTAPSKEKTYTYDVNQQLAAQGSALATNRQFMLAWVNSLMNLADGYWTCMGSSDGSGGSNYDVVDGTPYASRWSDASKLVWDSPGNNHSWIVLQTGAYNPLVGNVQILIDLNSSDSGRGNIYMSSSGLFSGGNATTSPTASDQIDVHPFLPYGSPSLSLPGDVNSVLHVISANDNTATYIIGCYNNSTILCWGIFKPKDAETTNWINDWCALSCNDYGSAQEYQFTYYHAKAYINSIESTLYLTSEQYFLIRDTSSYPIVTSGVADDNSGEYPLSIISLWSNTPKSVGLKGIIPDLYFGLRSVSTGDTYPGDGSKTWAQFGDLVFPWNGTTPVII